VTPFRTRAGHFWLPGDWMWFSLRRSAAIIYGRLLIAP
jgi:hypothetical protein